MPGLGHRRRCGPGAGQAGEAVAEIREAAEIRQLQGQAGGLDIDRECDQVGRGVRSGSFKEFGSLLGELPQQR